MTERRLFSEAVPVVSTFEYHRDRPRAPHLEQEFHQPRLHMARDFVLQATVSGARSVSDLGCGDGGLLSLIRDAALGLDAWGYDFHPAAQEGWAERGVTAEALDVFGEDRDKVRLGDVAVMTEVLEHLADPRGTLRWLAAAGTPWLVCSSPWNEVHGAHSDCHAWAWDQPGYADMIREAGWTILRHEQASLFQVVLAHNTDGIPES